MKKFCAIVGIVSVLFATGSVVRGDLAGYLTTTLTVNDIGDFGGMMGGVNPSFIAIGDQFDLTLGIDGSAVATILLDHGRGYGGIFENAIISASLTAHAGNAGSYNPSGVTLDWGGNRYITTDIPLDTYSGFNLGADLSGGDEVEYTWFDMMGGFQTVLARGPVHSISLRFDIPFTTVSYVGQPLMDIFPTGGGSNGYANLEFLDPNADEYEGTARVSFGVSDFNYQAVPEPGTAGLILLGVAMTGMAMRRTSKKS